MVSDHIRIEQHSDFRWRRAKAWKRCQAWFWIDRYQNLQPNRSQKTCDVWKPCSNQRSQDELKIFWAICLCKHNHLLCYWPTIYNSIPKICPKFQVLSSFELDELLDEHWAKIVQSKNISAPIYVECENMYRSKVCFQEFSNFESALIFNVRQKICCRWRNTMIDIPFFRAIDQFRV